MHDTSVQLSALVYRCLFQPMCSGVGRHLLCTAHIGLVQGETSAVCYGIASCVRTCATASAEHRLYLKRMSI
jgi:hypothetical protein